MIFHSIGVLAHPDAAKLAIFLHMLLGTYGNLRLNLIAGN
jgi:hypothetical protein